MGIYETDEPGKNNKRQNFPNENDAWKISNGNMAKYNEHRR